MIIIAGFCLMVVGCRVQAPSMNVQRSALRSLSDMSATFAIENIKNHAEAQKQIMEYSTAALKWLENGEIDKKTAIEVGKELKKIVPKKYWSFVDMAMDALDNVQADPQAILGKDNVRRLIAFFTGTKIGATKCDLKYIQVKEKKI